MQHIIKVLVVDDSPVVRQSLGDVLGADPEIEVIGSAADPFEAVALMRERAPDVLTLDIEMPKMDGLTFLERIMAQHPLPVVVCSSHTTSGSKATLRALELGAVDVITKPRMATEAFLAESQIMICDAVKAASRVPASRLGPGRAPRPRLTADAVVAKGAGPTPAVRTDRVIVIGASTGGTEAISVLLEGLPAESPGIVIVQHMPEAFTGSFAQNLDTFCRMTVREAKNGDQVLPGLVLIAPGGRHTLLRRQGTKYFVEVREGPLVSRHRPSVDVLFRSAAAAAGSNALGIILTGMGDDGAVGMKELHDAGAATLAQDEASCVVFGMPKEAIRLGGVDRVLPLEQMPMAIGRACLDSRERGKG